MLNNDNEFTKPGDTWYLTHSGEPSHVIPAPVDSHIGYIRGDHFTFIAREAITAVDSKKGMLVGGEWFEIPGLDIGDMSFFTTIVWHTFGKRAANLVEKRVRK